MGIQKDIGVVPGWQEVFEESEFAYPNPYANARQYGEY